MVNQFYNALTEAWNTLINILVFPFIWRPEISSYSSRPEADASDVFESVHFPDVDQNEWKPGTLVGCPKDDPVEFVYSSASLAHLFIIVALLTLILFRRDLWTVSWN